MKKLFGKFLTFTLALVLGLTTLSAIGCGEGGNQFKGLVVGGVTTTYRVGADVNFDSVVVKVEYTDAKEDKTLTKNEYTIELPAGMTNPSDLTVSEGTYTITIVYLDPLFSNAKREKAIVINVVAADVENLPGETLIPTSFTLPDTYTVYRNNLANATNDDTDAGFEGKYMDVTDKNYYVGTDNGFTFLPNLRVNDSFRKFTANVAISVYDESATQYVALVAGEPADKVVAYSLEDTVVATVDTYNHVYKFEDALDGKKVKVEVEPSATIYEWDEGSLSAEFVIVKDAYNVSNATELSVLDNYGDTNHNWETDKVTTSNWVNWKTEKGLTDVTTSGIILHSNITLTKEDIPAEFFWTNPNGATEYTDANGNTMYVDTYAHDQSDFYVRNVAEGETFKFLGNYFTIDMSSLPVAASNGVNYDNESYLYGSDFSNITFLKIIGKTKDTSNIIMKNTSFIGNANVSSMKDSGGDPYYAGGVIMFKATHITADVENTIIKTSFIAYFPDGDAISNFKNVKAYDSNQSAMFTHMENEINLTNSYFERAGGPLIMLRDSNPTEANVGHSTLYVKDSRLISKVCGQELFFVSKNAQSKVGEIAQLSYVLQQAGLGYYAEQKDQNSPTYINAVVLILSAKNDLDSVIGDIGVEGRVVIENTETEKKFVATKIGCGYDSTTALLTAAQTTPFDPLALENNVTATVKEVQAGGLAAGKVVPVFGCLDNFSQVTYFDGTSLVYPVPQQYGGGATTVKSTFVNSDYVGLYYGGMTLVMGLNH